MFFEAVPDFLVTDYSARLCRIRITDVGEGLPCLFHANTRAKEAYTKTDENIRSLNSHSRNS